MMLFLNVFITDQGLSKFDRGLLPFSSRVDIFKYSLASLSVINWTKVIIYYELDTNYQNRRSEIDGYINSLFSDPIIYSFRNERQYQWKVAMNKLFDMEDDLVWFCCNDDHIFIDYNTDLLEEIETKLIDLRSSYEFVSCAFSHWPEALFYGHTKHRLIEENKKYFITIWRNCDSIQIVNKNLLRYWWFENECGDRWMPRPDTSKFSVTSPETACIIPYRELVRHFDGYTHNNGYTPNDVDINICPPLFIPDGFFNSNIKILFYSEDRKKGYVDVNPLKKNYSTIDREGTDIKCVLEDLPLFWRSRINTIESFKQETRLILIKRNEAIMKMSWLYIVLPIEQLEFALRFDNFQSSSDQMQTLNKNLFLYKIVHMLRLNLQYIERRLCSLIHLSIIIRSRINPYLKKIKLHFEG